MTEETKKRSIKRYALDLLIKVIGLALLLFFLINPGVKYLLYNDGPFATPTHIDALYLPEIGPDQSSYVSDKLENLDHDQLLHAEWVYRANVLNHNNNSTESLGQLFIRHQVVVDLKTGKSLFIHSNGEDVTRDELRAHFSIKQIGSIQNNYNKDSILTGFLAIFSVQGPSYDGKSASVKLGTASKEIIFDPEYTPDSVLPVPVHTQPSLETETMPFLIEKRIFMDKKYHVSFTPFELSYFEKKSITANELKQLMKQYPHK